VYSIKSVTGSTSASTRPGCPFTLLAHVLGSAQIRIKVAGEVWVLSGDCKRDHNPACSRFEVVPCDVIISEATFALPVYRWQSGPSLAREILR